MIRHLELFSGIGGFRKAIDLLGRDFSINTECIGYSEKDPFAIRTYKANFDTINETEIGDIEKFTLAKENIENLPEFNLLTGGFPCQSFSMMGKQHGFNDKRGNLFYRIIDILDRKHPSFVLLENVKNLKNHDAKKTYLEIKRALNDCGYSIIKEDIFNTVNFSLAQVRSRIYIFATNVSLPNEFKFSQKDVINSFLTLNGKCGILRQNDVRDILEKNVDSKYYLTERIKPTILSDGSKNFRSKSEINQLIARPLTATMVKMHRACQDNYYSDDFILSNKNSYTKNLPLPKEELIKKPIRKLTPKEALALQGFDSEFYENAVQAGISNHQLYKQAGNAVSINTVYAILHYLFITKNIMQYI